MTRYQKVFILKNRIKMQDTILYLNSVIYIQVEQVVQKIMQMFQILSHNDNTP